MAALSPPSPPDDAPRARLVAGMAAAIRETGTFHETTVADVVRHARTSRRTFYEHFKDREDCFLALFDDLSERHMAAMGDAASGGGHWAARVDRALAAYLAALAAEPEVARSCIQEIWSIGPHGIARARQANERWARQIIALVDDARRDDPDLRPISAHVATVIIGGFRDLVLTALDRGEDVTELQALGTDLIRRLVAH